MSIAEQPIVESNNTATYLRDKLELHLSLLEEMNRDELPSYKPKSDDSAIRPVYKAKTFDEKNVTVEDSRVSGLPVFTYEVNLSSRFDPKRHFKQFQQFSEGVWRDYALLILSDREIALLDLSKLTIVDKMWTSAAVHEIHVETFSESFSNLEPLISLAKKHLNDDPYPYSMSDLYRVMGLVMTARMMILLRTGMTGFFSFTESYGYSLHNPPIRLVKIDLSKACDGMMSEERVRDSVYLSSVIPLSQSVTLDLETETEFNILESVSRSFYKVS